MSEVMVRVARPDEAADAARPLVVSHLDDPGMTAFFPDPAVRLRAVRQVFGLTVADAVGLGHVYVALSGERVVGTAAWLPPGTFPPAGARRALASLPWLGRILWVSPRTFRSFVAFSMRAAGQLRGESVWFLAGLGVDPTTQRSGIGVSLMLPVLTRADADGHACVLHTQKEANLDYYRRFGFEVAAEAWRAANGPVSWTMRRPPATAPA